MYDALKQVWKELTGPDAAFEIEEIEVRGNSIKSYRAAPQSLRETWLSTQKFGERDYLVYGKERWTYAQAHKETASIAHWLKQQNISHGDRVAIAMRNYPEWMLCYWACVSQGITVVGINAWWVAKEISYALEDSIPKVLICDSERLARFNEIRSDFDDIQVVGVRVESHQPNVTPYSELTESLPQMPACDINPDDDACIFYTSGTTGQPKGAQLTHRGCVNNIMNFAFWGQVSQLAIARINNDVPKTRQDEPIVSSLVTTPLFHVTANNCQAHTVTVAGGKLVLMYKWDAEDALKLIQQEKITRLTGVPVMSRELIGHPDFDQYDTSSLLAVGGGGAQLQPDLVRKIDKLIESAHPLTGYGMTEVCGTITSISADFFIDKPESCGPAMPTFEIKCVDKNGETVAVGEPGELWVKGAPVIKGYLNQADATAKTITNGWLHTGDVAEIDADGFIYLVDRIKDMVLRGGENIYCAHVEAAIFSIEGIAECVVFAVEDHRLGEEVGAAIFIDKRTSLTADAIRVQLSSLIPKHEIPSYIWLQENPLPRNASGKFVKRKLKQSLKIEDAQ